MSTLNLKALLFFLFFFKDYQIVLYLLNARIMSEIIFRQCFITFLRVRSTYIWLALPLNGMTWVKYFFKCASCNSLQKAPWLFLEEMALQPMAVQTLLTASILIKNLTLLLGWFAHFAPTHIYFWDTEPTSLSTIMAGHPHGVYTCRTDEEML